MVALYYNQIRSVLKEECGWFEPNMDSKQYILDNRLKNYPYIVIRVTTGIDKESGVIKDRFNSSVKVFAINLANKTGWIKSINVKYYSNWDEYLLVICRKVWIEAVKRAKDNKLKQMTLSEFEQIINQKKIDNKK